MGTRNFRTLRWNIFAKTKKFAKPFSPVQTGPQSNLLSKKWSIISWHCRFKAVIPGCKAALVGQLMRSRSHAAAAASPGGPAPRTLVGTGCWCRGGGLPPPRTPTVGWNDFLKKKMDTCHVVPYSKIAFWSGFVFFDFLEAKNFLLAIFVNFRKTCTFTKYSKRSLRFFEI